MADISAGEAHPSRLGASPNFHAVSCLMVPKRRFSIGVSCAFIKQSYQQVRPSAGNRPYV